MELNRGDIVIVNLYPINGDAPQEYFLDSVSPQVEKIRTDVIISGNDENSILDTVIILPLSSNTLDDMFPYRLRIEKRDNLKEDSDVLINQITTLNKFKIKEKIAKWTQEEYDLVIQALCKNFQ